MVNASLAQRGCRWWKGWATERMAGWLAYGVLAGLCACLTLYGIADFGILDGNESLYVEAAREMALARDWAVPTLDGLPYLEKPPLFVWLLAAALRVGHPIEASARFVSAAAGLALILGTRAFALRLGIGRRGMAAPLILATSLGMVVMARVAMPDLLLTALFALGCFSFIAALREGSPRWARLAAGLLGAASLVKGLLPLALFALIAAAGSAADRIARAAMRRFAADPAVILLLLAPIGAWLLAIDASLPGAASYFIVDEHILRFLGRREPHDYYSGSPVYYVPRLLLFFFPWPGVLLAGWLARGRDAAPERMRLRRLLWLCVWIPFAFFSLSSAKANYYILLCLPPLAMLAADYLPGLLETKSGLPLVLAVALPGLVLAVLLALCMRNAAASPLLASLREQGAALGVAAVGALSLAAALLARTCWRHAALAALAAALIPLLLAVNRLGVDADPLVSARALAAYVRERYGDTLPVFLFEDFEAAGALPIYLGHVVPVIDSKSSDLHFGRRVSRRHPSLVGAAELAASGRGALVVVLDQRRADFAATRLAARAERVARIGRAGLYRIGPPSGRSLVRKPLAADAELKLVPPA